MVACLPSSWRPRQRSWAITALPMSRDSRIHATRPEASSVKVRDASGLRLLMQDASPRRTHTLSEEPDDAIYVTSSRLHDMN